MLLTIIIMTVLIFAYWLFITKAIPFNSKLNHAQEACEKSSLGQVFGFWFPEIKPNCWFYYSIGDAGKVILSTEKAMIKTRYQFFDGDNVHFMTTDKTIIKLVAIGDSTSFELDGVTWYNVEFELEASLKTK